MNMIISNADLHRRGTIVCSNGSVRVTFASKDGRIIPVARTKEAHIYTPGACYVPKDDYRQMVRQAYGVLATIRPAQKKFLTY